MSGHRPWSLVKRRNKPSGLVAAPAPPLTPIPPTPIEERTWGPVTFREAPEPLIRSLIKVIDEGRISDTDVSQMIDWAQAGNGDFTLTWTEIHEHLG